MSQSKREQVVSHLRYIRQELREMHQGVMDDGLLPEAGEVRGVMAQMEALLELLEGKGSRKSKGQRRLSPGSLDSSASIGSLRKSSQPAWLLLVPIPRPRPQAWAFLLESPIGGGQVRPGRQKWCRQGSAGPGPGDGDHQGCLSPCLPFEPWIGGT